MSDNNAVINVNGDGYDANAPIEQECRDKKHGKTGVMEYVAYHIWKDK